MVVQLLYLTAVRMLGWLAQVNPRRYGDGRRVVGAAPLGRRATPPDRSTAPVLAGPGCALCLGPRASRRTLEASNRHPGHVIVVSPPPDQVGALRRHRERRARWVGDRLGGDPAGRAVRSAATTRRATGSPRANVHSVAGCRPTFSINCATATGSTTWWPMGVRMVDRASCPREPLGVAHPDAAGGAARVRRRRRKHLCVRVGPRRRLPDRHVVMDRVGRRVHLSRPSDLLATTAHPDLRYPTLITIRQGAERGRTAPLRQMQTRRAAFH